MTDPLIDEDGRCRRTDLLPSDCGCAAHRGGETVDEFEGVLISRFLTAKYEGRCALDRSHRIELGELIGRAVQESNLNDEIGWVCESCCDNLTKTT
jgi:hypothetical protein